MQQTIFIASTRGSKSLASFLYRSFHFWKPTGLRLAFDAAERNRKFGCIKCQRSKVSRRKEKKKRGVFLCRKTVRFIVKGKLIPTNLLKIEGRRPYVGTEKRKEGQLVELVDYQSLSLEAPPKIKRESMETSGEERWRTVGVSESSRKDDPME